MPIEIIIFGSVIIYTVIYSVIILKLAIILHRAKYTSNIGNEEDVKFSIVIAAKDEIKNLDNLISSLKNLNYPVHNYEVIIVDDNSTDETFIKAQELSASLKNFKVIKSINKSFAGKRGALDYGISNAAFSNILITDADCLPDNNWLRQCAITFSTGCDFIFGVAPFFQSNTLVNKVSCFENFRSSLLSFAAANMSLAYTASARNFGFRKEAFYTINGYKNTTETLSGDDDLLLREAIKNNKRIGTFTLPGSFVYSESKKTFKEYFTQRARHTQTSFHYLPASKLLLALWHTINISFILSPLLLVFGTLFIFPIPVKLILDILTGIFFQKKFGYKFSVIQTVYLQILYEIFLVVHFFRAKFGKATWK